MNRLQSERRKTVGKSRYTLGGWLMPTRIAKERIYEPTYQLTSNCPANFDHIRIIIRKCIDQGVEFLMPIYDPEKVSKFVKNVSNDIKFRIKIQNFDRMRTVVIVNVMEKKEQSISWQMGTLFDSNSDGWTSVEFETPTYIVSAIVACIYWD